MDWNIACAVLGAQSFVVALGLNSDFLEHARSEKKRDEVIIHDLILLFRALRVEYQLLFLC